MHFSGRKGLSIGLGLLLLTLGYGCGSQPRTSIEKFPAVDAAGDTESARYVPTGQLLTPAGWQIPLPAMRPQGLALSPDGELLAVAGNSERLLLLSAKTGETLQTIPLSLVTTEVRTNKTTNAAPEAVEKIANKTNSTTLVSVTNTATLSFTGLAFSPEGGQLYLSNSKGTVWTFRLEYERVVGKPRAFSLPETDSPKQRKEIPSGLIVSPDGRRLYVTGNLGNMLYELDSISGLLLRSWETGVAPYDVVLVGNKAYVSNLGGPRPGQKDRTALAGLGMRVRVDSRDIANEGSVTVIDLQADKVRSEIRVELHPSALAISPNQRYVVVANTGSDTLSVIDTTQDMVVEKISARLTPSDLFGAQPTALAFAPSGRRLFVC